jgi:hypothetical protein
MRTRFRPLALALAGLLVGLMAFGAIAPMSHTSAQGSTKTETIELEPFTSIQINGGGSATLIFGDTPSVTITGNSLIVDQLDANVEDGQLVLGSPLTSALDVTGLSELTYEIVVPSIEEIHLAGTITLDVATLPAQPSLVIGLTTGATLNIDAMNVLVLTGKLDLLSTANLAGAAEVMRIEVNNGSELSAADLRVGEAELVVNGVAKATVRVTDVLTGRASQASTVHYISETVTPEITLTTLATVSPLPYTPWVAPEGMPMPLASPDASPTA